MNPRTAPLVRVVGGLSLALLCVLLGLQQNASEWAEAPAPSPEDVSPVLDEAISITPAAPAPAPAAVPLSAPTAAHPALASCGPSCSGVAAPVELSWGTGHVAAARVSAPAEEEAPPARGADVAIAFAQAAAQSAAPAAGPSEPSWPAPPVVPTPPGSGWLQPVVSALFDADPPAPTPTATDPTLPTASPPQGTGTTPTAVPLTAQPTPEGFVPSATAAPTGPGVPSKRHRQPGDKANGSTPAPLAAASVPARGGTGQGGGSDPDPSDQPFTDTPSTATSGQGPGQPFSQAPDHVPAWVPPVSGPGLGPVDNNPQPGVPSPWAPLLSDPPLVDRVAAPQPRAEDLLIPNLEPTASPLEAVVAAVVAEPGSLALLALAALGMAGLQRQRASQAPQRAR